MSLTDAKAGGREAQRVLTAELLSELRHQAQSQTEWAERLAGQIVNHTLEVWSGTFDASGVISRSYEVAAGCIVVNHLGVAANIITVSSAGPGSGPPGGTGTYPIAGGTTRTVALGSRAFALYGTAGDRVGFQVFTAAVRPVSG